MKILGELCTFRAGGAFPQSEQGAKTGDYPFAKVADLSATNGSAWTKISNWITEAQRIELNARIVPKGSIVFAKIGEGLRRERFAVAPMDMIIDNNLMAAVPNLSLVDSGWLYYKLKTLGISQYSVGSALPYLKQSDLDSLPVELPDRRVQEKVSRTLGALDDKIAANRSLIDVGLELLDSRFEDARKPVGGLTVSQLAQVVLGGTPSRKIIEYWGGDVPWINSGACNSRVISSASEMITRVGLEKSAAKMLPAGTTCVAITGATLGQMGWLASPMAANQSVVGVVASPGDRLWLHFAVRAEREQLMGWATGGAQQHVNKKSVGSLEVSYDSVIAKNFGAMHQSLMERVVLAVDENEILATTRDELLPLLISGKITVKDAEKTVEEVV